ncbi:MAG: DUF6745 domain-containing protein [Cyanobacteria bacterium J06560_6]
MKPIQILTPEQEALIPEYQEKWRRIVQLTTPLEKIRAEAAIKGAYALLKLREPDVIFCESPQAALRQLSEYVEAVEPPEPVAVPSEEDFKQGRGIPNFLLKAYLFNAKRVEKRSQSGAKSIHELIKKTSDRSRRLFLKHVDRCVPRTVSFRDALEYSFQSGQAMAKANEELMAEQGDATHPMPDLTEVLDGLSTEDQEQLTTIDRVISWFPPKNWLLRWWIKLWVSSALLIKMSNSMAGTGQYQSAVLSTLSEAERQFLDQNPSVPTQQLASICVVLDFGFSELNYPPQKKMWAALQGLTKHCGWIFAVENICVVCDRPTGISLDNNGMLHNPNGEPAIEYSDGFKIYAYHGVVLPERYGIVPSNQWQAQWVIEESSKSLQALIMKEIGAVRLSQELAVEEIKTVEDYTLLKLTDVKPVSTFILRRCEASTGELYAVRIPHRPKSMTDAVDFARRQGNEENFPLLEMPVTNEAV